MKRLDKPKNTFILTTGLSGSSVLTGLISQAGHWCGEKTEYKNNQTGVYETFENSEFVDLNNRLVQLLGIKFSAKSWYDDSLRDQFSSLFNQIDLTDFYRFAEKCMSHQPWVLKDPKLWLTIGFWLHVFVNKNITTIALIRDSNALWMSQVTKKIIYDYRYLKKSELASKKILLDFLDRKGVDCLEQNYEHLIEHTLDDINKINGFLKINLTLKDWFAIYQPKKKTSNMIVNYVLVLLIYAKNYFERIR